MNTEESKTKEINKCRSLLKLFYFNLRSLETFNLSGLEKNILDTIRPHMDQVELEFNKLLLENKIKLPEQEENKKRERSIKR